eukprot:CAMPEP_0114983750 /NCGR_PEP_ID=MMETSP0216-20121206/6875_1 /TAXON_ID=223996 /ORGANISM="Protocruzia adherens, Strain Boccale" /LENGTH=712 /DNA_ID=CAMNT_0002345771 /DNA_START=655 /DNA_END=2790 /DNA_ORIENTATION=-
MPRVFDSLLCSFSDIFPNLKYLGLPNYGISAQYAKKLCDQTFWSRLNTTYIPPALHNTVTEKLVEKLVSHDNIMNVRLYLSEFFLERHWNALNEKPIERLTLDFHDEEDDLEFSSMNGVGNDDEGIVFNRHTPLTRNLQSLTLNLLSPAKIMDEDAILLFRFPHYCFKLHHLEVFQPLADQKNAWNYNEELTSLQLFDLNPILPVMNSLRVLHLFSVCLGEYDLDILLGVNKGLVDFILYSDIRLQESYEDCLRVDFKDMPFLSRVILQTWEVASFTFSNCPTLQYLETNQPFVADSLSKLEELILVAPTYNIELSKEYLSRLTSLRKLWIIRQTHVYPSYVWDSQLKKIKRDMSTALKYFNSSKNLHRHAPLEDINFFERTINELRAEMTAPNNSTVLDIGHSITNFSDIVLPKTLTRLRLRDLTGIKKFTDRGNGPCQIKEVRLSHSKRVTCQGNLKDKFYAHLDIFANITHLDLNFSLMNVSIDYIESILKTLHQLQIFKLSSCLTASGDSRKLRLKSPSITKLSIRNHGVRELTDNIVIIKISRRCTQLRSLHLENFKTCVHLDIQAPHLKKLKVYTFPDLLRFTLVSTHITHLLLIELESVDLLQSEWSKLPEQLLNLTQFVYRRRSMLLPHRQFGKVKHRNNLIFLSAGESNKTYLKNLRDTILTKSVNFSGKIVIDTRNKFLTADVCYQKREQFGLMKGVNASNW